MRFSIFEYSQEKLVSYGLDVTDALLLNWFVNFFCGKMEKQIFKESDGTAKIFGWVKTSKIIEDLPVIGIASEKGIRRRFDAFVEKGILDRKTVQTQGGKKSYYRPTAVYDSLINTVAIQKNQETKKDIENEVSQRNENGLAGNTAVENPLENPQRTKTTYAKNQPVEKAGKVSQRNCDGLAERNENRLAQGNFDGLALNNSLTNDSLNIDYAVKNSAAAISVLSEKYFGKNVFDSNFADKAADFLSKNQITNPELYFEFIKNKLSEKLKSDKKVQNPRSYAYTLFFGSDIATEFLEKQKELEQQKADEERKRMSEEKQKLTCPVCQNRFLPDFMQYCPKCDFEISKFSDTKEALIHSQFLKLPPGRKTEYSAMLNEIYRTDFIQFLRMSDKEKEEQRTKQKMQETELNKRFGLTG